MRKNLLQLTLIILIASFIACKDNNDDKDLSDQSYFTVNVDGENLIYYNSQSSNVFAPNYGDLKIYGNNPSYGPYQYGVICIYYPLHGEGEYTITDINTFAANGDTDTQYLFFQVFLGTTNVETNQVSYWPTTDAGKAQVTIVDGKYHFTVTDPIILHKTEDASSIINAPSTIKMTLKNGRLK